MIVPLYNAELAPPEIRGSLVALQQLAVRSYRFTVVGRRPVLTHILFTDYLWHYDLILDHLRYVSGANILKIDSFSRNQTWKEPTSSAVKVTLKSDQHGSSRSPFSSPQLSFLGSVSSSCPSPLAGSSTKVVMKKLAL